jgi:ribosomal protein S18 acetylase RimI-like enzyme
MPNRQAWARREDPSPSDQPPRNGILGQGPATGVERITAFSDEDLAALCEAADAAIIEGGGFGWVTPPGRVALEAYFQGLLLVPGRELFASRLDGVLVGSAQLVRPPRNNEAQAFAANLMHSFVAPYARGHGLARSMTLRVEEGARALGYHVLNLDVRETQLAAIALYESLGYIRWGVHPCYARVGGKTVRGIHYFKPLQPGSRIAG